MKIQSHTKLLWLFITVYIFYFSLVCIIKYYTFAYLDFDLAVHALTLWNIVHGSLQNSILGIPFLGNHLHLILFLVALPYALFTHPVTLLLLQTIALGLGALPLYLLARRILGSNWALIICIMYLLYPALGYTNLYEFHPTALAVPLLITTFYFYWRSAFIPFLIFMILSMFCQENIPLGIIMFGAIAFFNRRPRRWIITPVFLGGFYFFIALSLISHFNNNTIQFSSLYSHLGDTTREKVMNVFRPYFLLKVFTRSDLTLCLLQIFGPLALLPFFSPVTLLPALPFFLQHVFSNRFTELSLYYHYAAEIIPFIFISLIFAIKFFIHRQLIKRQTMFKIALVSMSLLSSVFVGPHLSALPQALRLAKNSYFFQGKDGLLEKIPPAACVVATFEFLPHLAERRFLYSFHHVYRGRFTLSRKVYQLPDNAEFALINFNDPLTFSWFYHEQSAAILQEFLRKGWVAKDAFDSTVLFERSENNRSSFSICEELKDTNITIPNKTSLSVAKAIELMGYAIKKSGKKDCLEISLYWRCIKATEKNINFYLDFISKDGLLRIRSFLPICYRIFPTDSWKAGQMFKDTFRFNLPPDLKDNAYTLKIGFFDFYGGRLYGVDGVNDELGRATLFNGDGHAANSM